MFGTELPGAVIGPDYVIRSRDDASSSSAIDALSTATKHASFHKARKIVVKTQSVRTEYRMAWFHQGSFNWLPGMQPAPAVPKDGAGDVSGTGGGQDEGERTEPEDEEEGGADVKQGSSSSGTQPVGNAAGTTAAGKTEPEASAVNTICFDNPCGLPVATILPRSRLGYSREVAVSALLNNANRQMQVRYQKEKSTGSGGRRLVPVAYPPFVSPSLSRFLRL